MKMIPACSFALTFCIASLLVLGCDARPASPQSVKKVQPVEKVPTAKKVQPIEKVPTMKKTPTVKKVNSPAVDPAHQAVGNLDIVREAREQIGVTTKYVPSYRGLAYPNGDVPRSEGVCADVVIRALRDARQIDLQKLMHEDMIQHFSVYPKNWKNKKADANIDHRRVLNQICYFKRRGWSQPATQNPADYQPGDIVTCLVNQKLPHVMIVSDRKNVQGIPLIIHNIGSGAKEEDCLFTYPLTGHFRVK